ncbi:MAG: SGNH/GDSL hydrolase family protein [Phycisphaeraceae bacterium]|nr:SGNH/GDSL hydrolase family protein [Phycisphaeraceae bacterium]
MKLNHTLTALLLLLFSLTVKAADTDVILPEKGVADPDGKIVWYDGKLLPLFGKGWQDTASYYDRLPAKAKEIVRPPVWSLSRDSSGMYVRFHTNAKSVKVRWRLTKKNLSMGHMPATGVSGIDLYTKNAAGKWQYIWNFAGKPRGVTNTATLSAPAMTHEFMLYLPLYNGVRSLEIGIDKNKSLMLPTLAASEKQKPIVVYGTSITQGACASRPGMSATAMIGRRFGMPVINLGFSGNGRMDSELAPLFAELDTSLYILDNLWNMPLARVKEHAEPFIRDLHQRRPQVPILLVEDMSYLGIHPTAKGKVLYAIFNKLVAEGIKNIYFLSNEGMLGDDSDGTVDGLHPNDLGLRRQADVFIAKLSDLIKQEKLQILP